MYGLHFYFEIVKLFFVVLYKRVTLNKWINNKQQSYFLLFCIKELHWIEAGGGTPVILESFAFKIVRWNFFWCPSYFTKDIRWRELAIVIQSSTWILHSCIKGQKSHWDDVEHKGKTMNQNTVFWVEGYDRFFVGKNFSIILKKLSKNAKLVISNCSHSLSQKIKFSNLFQGESWINLQLHWFSQ